MKRILLVVMLVIMALGLVSCTDADVASSNISRAADMFEVTRRIVFYNGITGEYLLEIQGLCSLGNYDTTGVEISVTCKVGDNQFKKHYLGLSDNVTYFAEQIDGNYADVYFYRVVFKPSVIIPDIDLELP